ncbi:MAG: glycoside hydrolase family 18 protein [Tidjanibacter sp.]|nr:glycoside hydrolase family 18 protein [Tidjanibacter sp.]
MRIFLSIIAASALLFGSCSAEKNSIESDKVVIAYVTSWSSVIPDPAHITHINYAFGHVTNSFDGVRIDNPERLKTLVDLKEVKPELKVMLSVGGWGSGRFSEMAATDATRKSFAKDCLRVVNEFGLDGIDIDWEYPTNNAAGISASPDDTENFTLLMKELREALPKDKQLTMASVASGEYVNFKEAIQYMDFVNIMTYDMASAPKHHSGMYRSEMSPGITCEEGILAHIEAGVPVEKLVFGMPFYGRASGALQGFNDYKNLVNLPADKFTAEWDDIAKAPYIVEIATGDVVCTYDDPRSIAIKCDYIAAKGMKGAMYWDYDGDTDDHTLARAVWEGVMNHE